MPPKTVKQLHWEITTLSCAIADAIEHGAPAAFVTYFSQCIARRKLLLKEKIRDRKEKTQAQRP